MALVAEDNGAAGNGDEGDKQNGTSPPTETMAVQSPPPPPPPLLLAAAAASTKRSGNTASAVVAGSGAAAAAKRPSSCPVQSKTAHNANRRRLEDNLAVIFMGIVLFFLVSHFPRIFLALHELFVPPRPALCINAGKRSFALWVHIFTYFSHLMLVLNSCVNSLIYCGLSSRFRNQGRDSSNSQ